MFLKIICLERVTFSCVFYLIIITCNYIYLFQIYYRLVHPKVVRACTIVLGDWEQLSPRILKSAVTLLHRISFNCKSPAMLYQVNIVKISWIHDVFNCAFVKVSLFRVFQTVLHASFDKKGAELRRLAVYIVRHFVELAPSNPKIYAELLFYKGIRECNDLENNYDGPVVE